MILLINCFKNQNRFYQIQLPLKINMIEILYILEHLIDILTQEDAFNIYYK